MGDSDDQLPRGAVRIARAYLVLAGLAAVAGIVAGLLLQWNLWSPEASMQAESYARLVLGHGMWLPAIVGAPALAGMFGYVAVPQLLGARVLPVLALAWIGVGLWGGGVAMSVIASQSAWGEDRSYLVAGVLSAAGGLVAAVHLGVVIATNARRAGASAAILAITFVGAIAAACTVRLIEISKALAWPSGGELHGDHVLGLSCIAAMALATAALAADSSRRPPWLLVLAAAGAMTFWLAGYPTALAPSLVMWGWGFGGGLRWRRPAASFAWFGIVPALLAYATATRVLATDATDVHLHDTFAVVGQEHLLYAALWFAVLAGLHAWARALVGRVPDLALATVGGVLTCAGALTHAIAMIVVGTRGMPRRYFAYLDVPELVTMHRIATVGALVAVAGLATIVIAWLRGNSRNRPPPADPRSD